MLLSFSPLLTMTEHPPSEMKLDENAITTTLLADNLTINPKDTV